MSEAHVPEPSVARFERELGAFLADRKCNCCHERLGPAPRKMVRHMQLHPSCWRWMQRHGAPGPIVVMMTEEKRP